MSGALLLATLVGGILVAHLRTIDVSADPRNGGRAGRGDRRTLEIQPRESGHRFVLVHLSIEGVAPEDVPERVRITVRTGGETFVPGDWVRLWAVVSPPYEPVAPGAFDFARKAYFQRIGGMGFAMGAPRHVDAPIDDVETSFRLSLDALRHGLAQRILTTRPDETGAVAAALLIGERGAIPKDVLATFRDAGIAHLLAISGLHVRLVAGLIFVFIRVLLALIEPVALRYPNKKWAAAITLLGTFGYLLISGVGIPTQRAFVMTGLVLIAILLDRTRISMRLIAWAAIAVSCWLRPKACWGRVFKCRSRRPWR